jgi:Cache domain
LKKSLPITPLQYRTFAGIAISAATLVLCLYTGSTFKYRAEQAIYRETENTARMLMTSFEETMEIIDARLSMICDQVQKLDLDLNEEFAPDTEKRLHDILHLFSGSDSIAGPALLNKRGSVVASGIRYPVPAISHANNDIFRIHADNPDASKLFIGRSAIARISLRWSLLMTRPLRTKSGDFAGVALMGYRLSSFSNLYSKLNVTDHGFVALIGHDGIVRIRTFRGLVDYDSDLTPSKLAYPRVLKGQTHGNFHDVSQLDGKPWLGTFISSETIPFYVISAYDNDYFQSQYVSSYIALGSAWLIISLMIVVSIYFITRLERVRRQAQFDIADAAGTATARERQNLALLAHLNSRKFDVTDLKRRTVRILTELRCLVDISGPIDGDINLILSSVRHRLGSAIELSNIQFNWQVPDLPKIAGLTTRDALAVQFIVLEALSNVIHHSKAKSLTIEASHDAHIPAIIITITDDGCGFNQEEFVNKFRGINGMKKRAKNISSGAILSLNSVPGWGTKIVLELTMQR